MRPQLLVTIVTVEIVSLLDQLNFPAFWLQRLRVGLNLVEIDEIKNVKVLRSIIYTAFLIEREGCEPKQNNVL